MPKELLGTTIGKLRNKLHRLMKQRYAAEASIKLTVEEFILLTMIRAKTDQILQNIAIATGKNKSVVMRMIDSLEKKGLVKRTVNPEDRRENLLSTTDMGEQVVAEYHKIEKKLSYELLKGIPDEKVEVFFEVVEEISRRTNRKIKLTSAVISQIQSSRSLSRPHCPDRRNTKAHNALACGAKGNEDGNIKGDRNITLCLSLLFYRDSCYCKLFILSIKIR